MKLLNNNELSKISGGQLTKEVEKKINNDNLYKFGYRCAQVACGGIGSFVGAVSFMGLKYDPINGSKEKGYFSYKFTPAMLVIGALAGLTMGLKVCDRLTNSALSSGNSKKY